MRSRPTWCQSLILFLAHYHPLPSVYHNVNNASRTSSTATYNSSPCSLWCSHRYASWRNTRFESSDHYQMDGEYRWVPWRKSTKERDISERWWQKGQKKLHGLSWSQALQGRFLWLVRFTKSYFLSIVPVLRNKVCIDCVVTVILTTYLKKIVAPTYMTSKTASDGDGSLRNRFVRNRFVRISGEQNDKIKEIFIKFVTMDNYSLSSTDIFFSGSLRHNRSGLLQCWLCWQNLAPDLDNKWW